jgi:hypothetical protein
MLKDLFGYEVFFFDESRFGTHSKLGHGWFPTGSRSPVKQKLGFKNFYLYSAVSPKTGDTFTLLMPYVNTEVFNLYLQDMSYWLGDNRKACLVMDQAGWHNSKGLSVPDNIKILYLPPYSPELNPAERLWHYIKSNTIKNEIYDNLADLENAVCAFLNTITSDIVKSLCHVNYMPYYL